MNGKISMGGSSSKKTKKEAPAPEAPEKE